MVYSFGLCNYTYFNQNQICTSPFFTLPVYVGQCEHNDDTKKDKELWATLGQGDLIKNNSQADYYGTSSDDDEGNYAYKCFRRESVSANPS